MTTKMITVPTEMVPLPSLTYRAPLIARGYITFYNLRPEQKSPQFWVCDQCAERVPKAKHEAHIKRHGWGW